MEFHCTTCGHKLTVPDTKVGQKGRCPRCREVLSIPSPDAEPKGAPLDRRLLDVPEPTEEDQSETAYEELRAAFGGRILEPEEIPQRKYPWIVDIFLYPLNVSALTILLICVGGPFCLRVALKFCMVLTGAIPVLLIFWVIFLMLHWAALLLLGMYMIWYVFAAMRDSAEGGIRAPNTGASTPGLAELLSETFKLFITALFCMAPALVYLIYGGGTDTVFWTLYGLGGFVFPMALLAVVMYESLRGLNPFLLLRSIARTPIQYLFLVPLCYVLCLRSSTGTPERPPRMKGFSAER